MSRVLVDSGIDWVKEIPENWNISKIGQKYALRATKVSDRDYEPLSVTYGGVVPQLENVAKTDAHDDRKLVKKGDFAINSRSDRRGACGIADRDGSVSLINTVLKPYDDMVAKYYEFLFHSTQFGDEFYKWGHGIVDDLWTTRWQDMKKISIPVPPVDEQQKIADFLDTQTAKIDAAINEAKELIEKYKAYKQSVITEAVTKGLNPDVQMKDSGTEWIGEIPEHWDCHPVYVYFEERKSSNYKMQEQNLLSLSYGKIIRKDINTNGGLLPASFTTYNIVEDGDIIIRPTDLQNDQKSLRTGLATERGIITSAYIDLKPKYKYSSRYYHYMLHAADVCKVFYNMGNGVRQGLNYSEFAKLMMISPVIVEQQQIADFLDAKCSKIDAIITQKEQLISQLQEYKKSIIFEYVTGKKEVTNG